jgi:hypothetical protein
VGPTGSQLTGRISIQFFQMYRYLWIDIYINP